MEKTYCEGGDLCGGRGWTDLGEGCSRGLKSNFPAREAQREGRLYINDPDILSDVTEIAVKKLGYWIEGDCEMPARRPVRHSSLRFSSIHWWKPNLSQEYREFLISLHKKYYTLETFNISFINSYKIILFTLLNINFFYLYYFSEEFLTLILN